MDLTDEQLLELALAASEDPPDRLPPGLTARIVERARWGPRPGRHPGWSDPGRSTISSLDAFVTTVADVGGVIAELAPDDWRRPTRMRPPGVSDVVSVEELVRHLVGVERYFLGQITGATVLVADRQADHWSVTDLADGDRAGRSSTSLPRAWWKASLAVVTAAGALPPDHQTTYHHLPGSLRGLLVVRTFELWSHGDDLRLATGQASDRLDADRLALMSGELVRVYPVGMALAGVEQPGRTARLELTGPGGGRYDVALAPGEPAGEPDIVLTVDVLDFCRVAARRLEWDQLDVVVEGERALAEPVLVGASAFAAD